MYFFIVIDALKGYHYVILENESGDGRLLLPPCVQIFDDLKTYYKVVEDMSVFYNLTENTCFLQRCTANQPSLSHEASLSIRIGDGLTSFL